MAKFDVIDLKKKKVGEIDLDDAIFAGEPNAHLFYEVSKMQQINRRAGTVAVKNSSLVSGGGKKPWRQKGTGRARQGSTRASHWVGGGKAMGPKPRDYTYRPPRQVRRAAVASALSLRAKEKSLFIVDAFPSEGKAKAAFEALTKGLGFTSALVVDEKKNEKLHRAVRNLANFDVLPPEGVNLESVLRRKTLVLTKAAAQALETALKKTRGPAKKEAKS
ncbi:MAG: 50S ribosomal protein L4 [Myxococcaceae bacterium]|nr:50S ribosomal protein L4 [Myxococcaceae bacterium]